MVQHNYWQPLYNSRTLLRAQIVQDVEQRLATRGNGPRNQAADDDVFGPLTAATAVAIGAMDYDFAISLFLDCFALVKHFEDQNRCEVHKGAMTFNVAVAYLRANDFA